MKRKPIQWGIAGLLLVGVLGWNLLARSNNQKAQIELQNPHQVGNVLLEPGKYLVVHEEHEGREVGQACTFFYSPPRQAERNEVARFRCQPKEEPSARGFVMTTIKQPDGTYLLRSIQFAGSSEAHVLEPAG